MTDKTPETRVSARLVQFGVQDGLLWLLLGLACYLLLALTTYSIEDPGWSYAGPVEEWRNAAGRTGAWFADASLSLLGLLAYLLPVLVMAMGLALRGLTWNPHRDLLWVAVRAGGVLMTLCAGTALLHLYMPHLGASLPAGGGGVLGYFISTRFNAVFNIVGGSLILVTVLLTGLTWLTGLSWLAVMDAIGGMVLWVVEGVTGLANLLAGVRLPVRPAPTLSPQIQTPVSSAANGTPLAAQPVAPSTQNRRLPAGLVLASPPSWRSRWQRWWSSLKPARAQPQPQPVASRGHRDDGPDPVEEYYATLHEDAQASRPAPMAPVHLTKPESAQPAPADAALPHGESWPPGDDVDDDAFDDEAFDHETMPDEDDDELEVLSDDEAPVVEPSVPVSPAGGGIKEHFQSFLGRQSAAPGAPAAPPPRRVVTAPASGGQVACSPDGALPPLHLLEVAPPSTTAFTSSQLEQLSIDVEQRLAEFGVKVEVTGAYPGPVVTLFELALAPGTKVSKISGLSRDLARALSTTSVRVVEIIPGKSVIGLEVPNPKRETVYLSEIIGSPEFQQAGSPLTLAMGKNISGQPVIANLAKMPHALIAGTTGSGKSVAINAMILSMLYKAGPDHVRLIMIDPKMLELSVYEGIPHLLTPVVTDMKEAANALRWCVGEMERRYKLMSMLKVRNLAGFNQKVLEAIAAGQPLADPVAAQGVVLRGGSLAEVPRLEPMPMIVVIIDELADMMMVVGKKVEELIARLAQKARASGIHLLLATQRPSVDVLTGLIKANIPTRVAFQVSSRIDSRTVLDQMGAEQLLGHGDMLFLPPGTSIPRRVHGAFVDDHEVLAVVEFLKATGEPRYLDEILQDQEEEGGTGEISGEVEDSDPLFDEAVRIVTESRRASISGVQRRLKIGYNRAARMVEEMERIGIVGPQESNGNREVLVPPPRD